MLRRYLAVFVVIAVGLVSLVGLIRWGVALAAPETPAVWTRDPGDAAGVYVFYDYENLSPSRYPIRGGHMLVTWKAIETGPGTYDWSWPDRWIADLASKGKYVGFTVDSYDGVCCGGSAVPPHVRQQHPSSVIVCNGTEIPRYWDPAYQRAWGDFIRAVGRRYNNDPRIAWVQISVGIYGETSPAEGEFFGCLESAGLTSESWINVVKWSVDLYREAFPDKQLFLQFAPYYKYRVERREFTDYAASRGVGLKHNGLKPDTDDAYITDPNLSFYGGGGYDPFAKWGDRVATGWEGYENQAFSMRGRTDSMWSIYNALDKHADILAVDTDLVKAADRQDLLQFANKYLGRTIADTPSVWIALRETEYTWFPEKGNFEFWLYQKDDAPGGRTVPLWRVGSAPEGRFTRRTDQATGNPDMYFDVDDRYIYGNARPVTVTVTYYDQGFDRWQLRYDAVDNPDKAAGTVFKTNTYTWKKATFVLNDALFMNRQLGGTDFHIWCLGDGDEIIHFVDVQRPAGVTVELELQSGVNGYSGASDTTLDAWSPDSAFGSDNLLRLRYNAGTPSTHMAPLLRFDLSSIPTGATVLEAYLDLYLSSAERSDRDIGAAVHGLLRPWNEAAATWQRTGTGQNWAQPGALGPGTDHIAAASDSKTLKLPAGWYSFNVTDLVKRWVADPAGNHGLMLQARAGTVETNMEVRFAARESGDPSIRPKLRVKYLIQPPTPTPTPTPQHTATLTPTPTATRTPTPVGVPRTLISRRASRPPVIDGDLSEWTQPEHADVRVGQVDTVVGQGATPEDISAIVLSYWTDGWLYFAARITDDIIVRDSAEIWEDDAVEFALDAAHDRLPGGNDDNQFTVASDGALTNFGYAEVPGAQVAVRRHGTGYDVELALPLSVLGIGGLVEGQTLGFTIGLIDDDDGGNRSGPNDTYLIWAGNNTVSGSGAFGSLILGAVHQLPPAGGTATPTLTALPGATVTWTPTATRTRTPTGTATATATGTSTATVIPTPTRTPTALPGATSTSTATSAPTPTRTPTVTTTATPGFGVVQGVAFYDQDGDGSQNPDEMGLKDVTLVLMQAASRRYTVTTQDDGFYRFLEVNPGSYKLAAETWPDGYYPTHDAILLAITAGGQLEINIPFRRLPEATPTATSTPAPTASPTGTGTPTVTVTSTATRPVPTPTSRFWTHRAYLPLLLHP